MSVNNPGWSATLARPHTAALTTTAMPYWPLLTACILVLGAGFGIVWVAALLRASPMRSPWCKGRGQTPLGCRGEGGHQPTASWGHGGPCGRSVSRNLDREGAFFTSCVESVVGVRTLRYRSVPLRCTDTPLPKPNFMTENQLKTHQTAPTQLKGTLFKNMHTFLRGKLAVVLMQRLTLHGTHWPYNSTRCQYPCVHNLLEWTVTLQADETTWNYILHF